MLFECNAATAVLSLVACSAVYRGSRLVPNHLALLLENSSLMMMMMMLLWLEAWKKRVQEWTLFFLFSQSIFDDNTDLLKSEFVPISSLSLCVCVYVCICVCIYSLPILPILPSLPCPKPPYSSPTNTSFFLFLPTNDTRQQRHHRYLENRPNLSLPLSPHIDI